MYTKSTCSHLSPPCFVVHHTRLDTGKEETSAWLEYRAGEVLTFHKLSGFSAILKAMLGHSIKKKNQVIFIKIKDRIPSTDLRRTLTLLATLSIGFVIF